jgi:aminoglycoside 6'-N-acetyltransferase I
MEKHNSEIEEAIEDSSKGNFIAETHEEQCGFIETSIRNYAEGCLTRDVGYIEGIYVEPEYRLKGMAKELIKTAEYWAISKGCKEMASDCLIDNEISIKAHISSGYKEVERLVHFMKSLDNQEDSNR